MHARQSAGLEFASSRRVKVTLTIPLLLTVVVGMNSVFVATAPGISRCLPHQFASFVVMALVSIQVMLYRRRLLTNSSGRRADLSLGCATPPPPDPLAVRTGEAPLNLNNRNVVADVGVSRSGCRLSSFRRLVAVTIAVMLSIAPAPHRAETDQANPRDPGVAMLFSEQALLDLTNADRATNGLSVLEFDPGLLPLARERASSQLGTQALSHRDASGELAFVQKLHTAGVGFTLAGENLARSGTNHADTAGHIEVALMNSPLHRKNILEQGFGRVAIGAATNAHGQIAYAEIFLSTTPEVSIA